MLAAVAGIAQPLNECVQTLCTLCMPATTAFDCPSLCPQSEFAALLVSMCKHQPELEAYATVFADAERSGAQLPESLLLRLAEVKGRADTAAQEAAAAEAAVQAVQQVGGALGRSISVADINQFLTTHYYLIWYLV